MKFYTVYRQDKFDYDCSVSLIKIGCSLNEQKAIEIAEREYEVMQCEYEDQMSKYSDVDIYDPDDYSSGALFTEEDNGVYFISFGADEYYESHTVWIDEWDVEE